MKKSILEIYAMGICFIAVIGLSITLVIAIYNVVKISNPGFTLNSHTFKSHQSIEAFIKTDREKLTDLSEEETTKLREESFKIELEVEKRSGLQSLISSAIALLIILIVLITHWRVAKRARANNCT